MKKASTTIALTMCLRVTGRTSFLPPYLSGVVENTERGRLPPPLSTHLTCDGRHTRMFVLALVAVVLNVLIVRYIA